MNNILSIEKVHLDDLNLYLRKFFSDRQHWNLQRSLTQLVSTSNKRSSSGEMKKDLKRVGIYRGMDLTLVLIKDELWRLIFTLLLVVGWSVISVMCGVWKAVAIKPDTYECVTTLIHIWGVWRWRNDITQFMSGVKELALFEIIWQTTQLIWLDQLNRFLALHALVEGLGICWATLGLKVPISLNWVRFRPGIWDGRAISSTGCGAVSDRAPTWGCLGFALIRGSKQCGMDILPIFQLRLGSSLLI